MNPRAANSNAAPSAIRRTMHEGQQPRPGTVRLGYDAPLLAAIAGRLARAVMQDMRSSVTGRGHCGIAGPP